MSEGAPALGDFLVRRELGRGGMGVVYEAEQISLRRVVALKVLPPHRTLAPVAVERFLREAALAAKLKHPGIVEVYAVGEEGGTHFFAMEFVRGSPLDRVLDRIRAAPIGSLHGAKIVSEVRTLAHRPTVSVGEDEAPRAPSSAWDRGYVETVARTVASIADALHHAHERGVVHRDVKPSNILLREDGSPVVTDFGLARALGVPSVTLTGEFAGTPHYVSPEQALSRKDVDGRSDVFSLGVTLYELLTLRRPFEGGSAPEILSRIASSEPRPPHEVNPEIARDLETICLTALEKDPDRRYPTAAAMAADLRRFLEFRPVVARPVGWAARTGRWARRNPIVAGLLGAVAVLLVSLVVVSVGSAIRLRGERDAVLRSFVAQSRAARGRTEAGRRGQSLRALAEAAPLGLSGDIRDEVVASLLLLDLEPRRRVPKERDLAFDADADLALTATSDEAGEIAIRRVDDGEIVLRIPGRGEAAYVLRIDPTGRRLAAAFHSAVIEACRLAVFDVATGDVVLEVPRDDQPHRFAFSPDGERLAVVEWPGILRVHDLAGRGPPLTARIAADPHSVEFDPAGRRVAISWHERAAVEIRDAATGDLVRALEGPTSFRGLAWSPDGTRLVGAGDDYFVYGWDADVGGRPERIGPHESEVASVAFDPTGKIVASVGWDDTLRFFDSRSGEPLLTRPASGWTLRFSSDGERFACEGPDGAAEVLDVVGRRERRELFGHAGPGKGPWMTSFSPDGTLLASGCDDAVRLWDVERGIPVAALPVEKSQGVLFHPDGTRLYTLGGDGLDEWPIERAAGERTVGPPRRLDFPGGNGHLAITDDGGTLAAVSLASGRFATFDLACPGRTRLAHVEAPGLAKVALEGTGRFVAVAAWGTAEPNVVRVWDRREPARPPIVLGVPSAQVAFSRDGELLLVGSTSGYAAFETRKFTLVRTLPLAVPAPLPPIAYSRDGRTLAVVRSRSEIDLRDARTFERFVTIADPSGRGAAWLAFSPDGGTLAVASPGRERVIVLYDVRAIRAGLAATGLDWGTPPIPAAPAPEPGPAARVTVLPR